MRVFDKLLLIFKYPLPYLMLLIKLKEVLRRQKERREGEKQEGKGRWTEKEREEGKGGPWLWLLGSKYAACCPWWDSQNSEGLRGGSGVLSLLFLGWFSSGRSWQSLNSFSQYAAEARDHRFWKGKYPFVGPGFLNINKLTFI